GAERRYGKSSPGSAQKKPPETQSGGQRHARSTQYVAFSDGLAQSLQGLSVSGMQKQLITIIICIYSDNR
ncbi:hypothetical protein GK48_26885, partial [Salmonella enterica subsp. diarizonae]|nr:hypothetical protein [Salmonella enterica subsp. diarizonae]